MEGGEGEVAGLGDGESGGDRLQIAHLTDENDVGIFAERVLEGGRERVGVSADLALVDDAALVAMDELDRIFDGDDVPLPLAVDLVDHRGEGRRFSRAGGTGDENEAARLLGHLGDGTGESELIEGLDRERNLPDDHRHAAALLEAVAAKAGQVLNAEGEIELVLGLEPLLLVLGEDRVRQLEGVLGRHHVFEGGVGDLTVHPQLRPLAGDDVEIGSVLGDHLLEEASQVDRSRLLARRRRRGGAEGDVHHRSGHCDSAADCSLKRSSREPSGRSW